MPEELHWIVAFDSTHAAMAAQKALAALHPYTIPTPREITADCGMSLRLGVDQGEEAMGILQAQPSIAELCHWHLL